MCSFKFGYHKSQRGPIERAIFLSLEHPGANGENIVAYVRKIKDRLEKMTTLAQQNMKVAQKTWYNKNAKGMTFQPGQQVLLLLNASDSKLLAKWAGPYRVPKCLGNVN